MTKEQQLEEFIDSLELRYFKGKEFTPYWSRTRQYKGKPVKNSIPQQDLWPNIVKTVIVLDEIRHQSGFPIQLTSTYRSPMYNIAVGGEPNSFHMRFMAIDFTSEKVSMSRLHGLARSMRGKKFDLRNKGDTFEFHGGIGLYVKSNFIHIDTRGYDANWSG